jgi:tetratricopeptide (TPR) repeat protein
VTEDTLAVADPFEPLVLEEQTELRALARALQFADGFKLLFVRCNQPAQRQRLVAALRGELPQLNVQEIALDRNEGITHLLDELQPRLSQPTPDAVFVSGLEYSLPTAADAHATPFVANLNATRNSFPRIAPCPLVLWVPEYVLNAIARGAPDFFSIRSGAYFFASAPGETADIADALTSGAEWAPSSLPLAEKIERIAAIESLLADYQSLPLRQRDSDAEARLLTQLGRLCSTLGRWADADAAFQQSLAICRNLGYRAGEGAVLNDLGETYRYRGHLKEAEEAYRQSVVIWKELNNHAGAGAILNNLGIVYRQRGQLQKAELGHQQSLTICQTLNDRIGEEIALNNLGIIYYQQGQFADADAAFQRSLALSQELGDLASEASAINNLGNTYCEQGRWVEAKDAYQRCLAIYQKLGDRVREGQALRNLALLQEDQADFTAALELALEALRVLDTTEDEAAKERAHQLIAQLEAQIRSATRDGVVSHHD